MVHHIFLNAALLDAQADDVADILLRHQDGGADNRFADLGDVRRIRQLGRIFHGQHLALVRHHLVHHCRRGGDEVETVFALEPFLDDLHVQHTEEAATEAEAERLRGLGFVVQRGVVELQLGERVAERLVFVRLDRIKPGEHARFDFLEAGQWLVRWLVGVRKRVADARAAYILDAGDDVTDLARREFCHRPLLRREHTDLLHEIIAAGRHKADLVLGFKPPVHHPHQRYRAEIIVEPGIDDERPQRRRGRTLRRRNVAHDGFENVGDADAGFGAGADGVGGVEADDVLDLVNHAFGVSGRQIDLVQHRQDGKVKLGSGVTVGHCLSLHALGNIHHQQRAFARRQRTRDFIGKVHVPRRVNHVQAVGLAVARRVIERHALGLNGDAALTFEIHRIEHLFLHFARLECAARLDETVGERGLAMIDVRDNGKIPDVTWVPAAHACDDDARRVDTKKAPAAPERSRILAVTDSSSAAAGLAAAGRKNTRFHRALEPAPE